jgi:hypothetical protein
MDTQYKDGGGLCYIFYMLCVECVTKLIVVKMVGRVGYINHQILSCQGLFLFKYETLICLRVKVFDTI